MGMPSFLFITIIGGRRAHGQRTVIMFSVLLTSLSQPPFGGTNRVSLYGRGGIAIYNHIYTTMQNKDTLTRPTYLTPDALRVWVPKLRAANRMYRFYQTPEWKRLRKQVLEANHYECEDCRGQSPTKITQATTVHHDQTVEEHPELALSTIWTDQYGKKHQQLFALCEECHNKRHERFGYETKNKPLTPERW